MDKPKENSSRNVAKKCYSLPILQKENEKLKNDLKLLQADRDEKEVLLTESLLKIKLLETQNHDLKAAAVANKEKAEMRDAFTYVKVGKKSVSTSTSVDSETLVETEDEDVDEAQRKPIRFDKTVLQLPYDEARDIKLFDTELANPQLSSFMKEHFQQFGGANDSKKVNNILNGIATKNLLKQFVWEKTASNSFQSLKNVLACIHSAVCSKETTQSDVNSIIKNSLKNARANK